MIDCQEKSIKKLCPTGANNLFQKYMPKMAKAVLNDHCAYYTEKEKCHILINRANISSTTTKQQNIEKQNNLEHNDQSTDFSLKQTQIKTQLKNNCNFLLKQKMFCFVFSFVLIFVLF